MVTRIFSRLKFGFDTAKIIPVSSNLAPNIYYYRRIHNINEVPEKEVQIPTQWGYIAGKLWGTDKGRPILALHGWQDNAGTWDPLAPILIKNRSILAIDFPGHGLSSWIPPGMQYHGWDLPRTILYIKEYYNWDQVSLLSHSMGSIAGLRFAALYPDLVDFYIGVDSLIYDDYDLNFVVDKYPALIGKGLLAQFRLDEEPPSYTIEELTKKWHLGTQKSVAMESVKYLIKRGSKRSKLDVNKFYFSRDSRLKYTLFNPEDKKFVQTLLLRMKSPSLYIKAIDSPYASDNFSVDMREVLEKNNDKFECHFVPGTHHVHLNNPEVVAPLITRFFEKYNIPI